jgi:thioesterase-3
LLSLFLHDVNPGEKPLKQLNLYDIAALDYDRTMSQTFGKFRYDLLILERHLDTFGHVNNSVYLEILEEARWDYITSRGYGLSKVMESGQGPVILEINMKFLKELKLRQKITVETQALSYEKKISKLKQIILNEKNEICFEAIFTFALFDLVERKIISPTPEWLHAIGGTQ